MSLDADATCVKDRVTPMPRLPRHALQTSESDVGGMAWMTSGTCATQLFCSAPHRACMGCVPRAACTHGSDVSDDVWVAAPARWPAQPMRAGLAVVAGR